MKAFVADPDFTLYVGDALEVLRQLAGESVHCVVTSPPYWGLRDYGTGSWHGGDPECIHAVGGQVQDNKAPGAITTGQRPGVDASRCRKCGARRIDQQLGLEATPDEYVARMVDVFREVRRVLRADGTCWLNIGDSYANDGKWGGSGDGSPDRAVAIKGRATFPRDKRTTGLKAKDLVGIPWRLAFALQTDGWYLRSDIIWSKPNTMPESVTDRPTKSHEYVFLLAKSARYFYDADAVREPYKYDGRSANVIARTGAGETTHENYANRAGSPRWPGLEAVADDGQITLEGEGEERAGKRRRSGNAERKHGADVGAPKAHAGDLGRSIPWEEGAVGRNRRTVWEIPTSPLNEAHFAVFPPALVEPCIKAGTSEHGCCAVCGAPWKRETAGGEGTYEARKALGHGRRQDMVVGGHPGHHRDLHPKGMSRDLTPSARVTVAWRPTCSCEESPVVPCIVLDPFMGSGTTALVARGLGRRAIGIELNPEYAGIAARRLAQLSFLAEPAA